MGNAAALSGSLTRRVIMEGLIGIPVWVILTHGDGIEVKLIAICAAAIFFIIGLLLYKLSPAWGRVTAITLMIVLLTVGIGYREFLPELVWMGALIWRGRYPKLSYMHYGLAFLICCLAVIVASQLDILSSYRLLFIGLSLVWIVNWFLSLNRWLLNDAALQNSIVTRPVRLGSLRYLLTFLAGALLVFALTVNYGEKLLTPPNITPLEENIVSEPDSPPPAQEQPSLQELLGEDADQGKPSIIWDIVFWTLGGLAAVFALFVVRMLWRDRTWTWRRFITSIRAWFVREKKTEALPYVEERRSLMKEKKKKSSRWSDFFQRSNRDREWQLLDNPQKVRRLYEDAVVSGIEQGYEFKSHHTSSETLERIAHWREVVSIRDKDLRDSYWSRLLSIRLTLIKLYEKARYSPHSVTDQEVESLNNDLNNDLNNKR